MLSFKDMPEVKTRPPLKRTLCGHEGSVECVIITPDGKRIVSASEDRTLRVWDVEAGRCLSRLDGGKAAHKHTQTIQGICFPPEDDSWLVTAGLDSKVNIWEMETGGLFEEALNTEHRYGSTCAVVTHDGECIITSGTDTVVRIWNIETNSCGRELRGHTARVNSLSVSKGALQQLASASSDGTIRVWTLEWKAGNDAPVTELRGHNKAVLCARISGDGRHVVSGGMDGCARLWDLSAGQDMDPCLLTFRDHDGPVTCVDLCELRSWMVTCGLDGTVRLVDLDSGLCMRCLTGHRGPVNSVAISVEGSWVVSGGRDKTVRLWDLDVGTSVTVTEIGPASHAALAAVSPDGRLLATASNLPNAQQMQTAPATADPQQKNDSVAEGKAAAEGRKCAHIALWDLDSGVHDPEAARVPKSRFECDAQLAWDGKDKGAPPSSLDITQLAFSRDGRFLVAGTTNLRESVWVWGLTEAQRLVDVITVGQRVDCMDVAFSTLAVGCKNGRVRVCSANGSKAVDASFRMADRVCEDVALSSDEKLLAVAVQWKVLVFAVATPEQPPLWELHGHSEFVACVAWMPGRAGVVSGSKDTTIRVWDLDEDSGGLSNAADVPYGGPPSQAGGGRMGPRAVVLDGHTSGVRRVLALAGGVVVSAGDDQRLRVWRGCACVRTMTGHSAALASLSSPADGSMVASVGEDHELRLWDLRQQPSREELWEMLEGTLADSRDQRFWHTLEAHPALILENSSCGGSPAQQNILHYLVWHDADDLVTRLLQLCPHAALVKDLLFQSPRVPPTSPQDKGASAAGPVKPKRAARRKATAVSLLRRVLARRSTSLTVTLLTRLSALLTDSQGLRNPRRAFEALRVDDLCEVMEEIPDLCVAALRPLLCLQPSSPSVSSGCSRRIVSKGETWTAGSQTPFPSAFWKDRFSTQLPDASHPPPVVEHTCLWRLWMAVLLRKHDYRRHHRRHYRKRRHGSAIHIGDAEGEDGGAVDGPPKALTPSSRLAAATSSLHMRLLSSQPEMDERTLHDRAGVLVRPCFVAIPDAAGPPFEDLERGAHSFLQACVDLSLKLGNAAIFETDAVFAVLSFKWHAFGRYMYVQELCRYLAFLVVFSSSCLHMGTVHSTALRWLWEVAILGLSAFFWQREWAQMTHQGWRRYFTDAWNYVDMITFLLSFVTFIARAADYRSNVAAVIGATALLPAWFKCLFYMRAFSSTGVMIRTIFEVIKNIRFFFLVVLLVILGFTQFYFIMSADPDAAPGAAPDSGRPASLASTFAEVFLFNLGVYNPEPVDFEETRSPRLTYFFYVVFVTINGVVLLNILIAIMGDSFNRVTAHAVLEWRLEQACIILELESLMGPQYFSRPDLFPRWLQTLQASEYTGAADEWSGAIGALSKRISLLERRVDERIEATEKRVARGLSELGTVMERVERELTRKLEGMGHRAAEARQGEATLVAAQLEKIEQISRQLMKEVAKKGGHWGGGKGEGPSESQPLQAKPLYDEATEGMDEPLLPRSQHSPTRRQAEGPGVSPKPLRTLGGAGGTQPRTFTTADRYAVSGGAEDGMGDELHGGVGFEGGDMSAPPVLDADSK